MKNTNLDIRFNKANNILNQFSDSWEDDKLNLLPNFPKIKDMVSNHITQENYLWLITYDLPNDLFDKIDNMGLVPYEYAVLRSRSPWDWKLHTAMGLYIVM